MTAKKTDAPVPAPAKQAQAKTTARSPFRETREDRRSALTHAQIADDLAAFERAGGTIEVLGNTQMLRAIPLTKSPLASGPAEERAVATSPARTSPPVD